MKINGAMSRKKKILLLIETSKSYGRHLIEGINRFAIENGGWTLHFEDRGIVEQSPAWLKKWIGDGVIARSANAGLIKNLKHLQIPYVELLGDDVLAKCEIHTDPQILGRIAVEHFIERNLKHFAFFALGQSWWSRELAVTFSRNVELFGYSCNICPMAGPTNALAMPLDLAEAKINRVVKWLLSLEQPVGIFCPSDGNAKLLLDLCQIADMDVPNKVAVLGFENNSILCDTTTPTLSSIIPDGKQIGYLAAERLNRKIERKNVLSPILIPPLGIFVRQSTEMLAVEDGLTVQAVRFIQDNVSTQLSVEFVAAHLDISSKTLVRRFRKYYDKTPEEYILHVRMDAAKNYLAKTKLTIEEIALRVGYSSSEYFAKIFKQRIGMTPKSYREKFSEID